MADYPLNRDADAPGGGLAGDPTGSAGASTAASDGGGKAGGPKETIVVKVALVGDSGVGKTSLMASAAAAARWRRSRGLRRRQRRGS